MNAETLVTVPQIGQKLVTARSEIGHRSVTHRSEIGQKLDRLREAVYELVPTYRLCRSVWSIGQRPATCDVRTLYIVQGCVEASDGRWAQRGFGVHYV